jgi:hypothetical protein
MSLQSNAVLLNDLPNEAATVQLSVEPFSTAATVKVDLPVASNDKVIVLFTDNTGAVLS